MKIDVVTAAEVDYDEVVRLQREAFQGVADQSQLDINQTVDYYRWKYTRWGSDARIAQIRNESGDLVAMNSAFAVDLALGGQITRGWQSCDTATHRSARGQGCFIKCLSALNESFQDGEVFFGYPNLNSRPGFTKFGCRDMAVQQVYAGVIPAWRPRPAVRRLDHFGPEHNALATRLAPPGRVIILRSARYLNERYCSALRTFYTVFSHPDGGFIVVRAYRMFRLRVCLIMECLAVDRRVERELYLQVGYWCLQQRCVVVLAFNTVSGCWGLLDRGLLPVPGRLSPRPIVLMARALGATAQPYVEQPWAAYVGDWDVF